MLPRLCVLIINKYSMQAPRVTIRSTDGVITTIKITPFNCYRKKSFAHCITSIQEHIILFTRIAFKQHRFKLQAIAVLWLDAGFDMHGIYENFITSGSNCMYLNCLPDSEVLVVIIDDGVPSPTDVLAVT